MPKKDGLYVTKNQQENQIPSGWDIMDKEDSTYTGDWRVMEKEESTYQSEYRSHMEMQDKLTAEKRYNKKGQVIEDGPEMQAVKRDMSVVTARLEEEIPEDITAFRAKLLDTTTLYDKLIESCTKYLKKHGGISSDAKRRGKMVTDIRNRAMSERRCFANLGASDHIHKDREEGMILGNVLGNYTVMNKITDVMDTKYEELSDNGAYLQCQADVLDEKGRTVGFNNYVINKQKNKLDKFCANAHVASTLTSFLGVGELVGNIDLVSFKKSDKERYFGIKARGKINRKDYTYTEILEQSGGNKVDIVYSNEALRQLSIIQILLALLGSKNIKVEDSVRMIGEHDQYNESCYRVSNVYLDFKLSDKFFGDDLDGKSLAKKKGDLPAFDKLTIPLLDKEFTTAVLAMRAEDLGVLAGTLITAKERKAFESRLSHIQKLIKERIKQDEALPDGEKTILSKEEWNSPSISDKLQNNIWKGNSQFCPEILRRNKVEKMEGETKNINVVCHVEGAKNGTDLAMKQYQEIYFTLRSAILAKKKGMERYLALTDLKSSADYNRTIYLLQKEEEGIEEPEEAKLRRLQYEDAVQRLLDEFTDAEVMKAQYAFKIELFQKLKTAYEEMNLRVKEIPKEVLQEDKISDAINRKAKFIMDDDMTEEAAIKKATESIQKQVREQYIWACICKENPELLFDLKRSSNFGNALFGSFRNRQYDPALVDMYTFMSKATDKFEKDYDNKNGPKAFSKKSDYVQEVENITRELTFLSEDITKSIKLEEKRIGNNKAKNLGIDIDKVPENV